MYSFIVSKAVLDVMHKGIELEIRDISLMMIKEYENQYDSGMKEIAYDLDFLDSAHFSRFFKSFAGTNFTDFKREPLNFPIGTSFNRAWYNLRWLAW